MSNNNSDKFDKPVEAFSARAGNGAARAAYSGVPRIGPEAPWLAPLAGHTDLVFRVLCRELGAAVTCTEMVSAKGLIYGERGRKKINNTVELLRTLRLPDSDFAPSSSGNRIAPVHAGEDERGSSGLLNATGSRCSGRPASGPERAGGADERASHGEPDDSPAAMVALARSAAEVRGELLVPESFPADARADSPLVVQLFGDEPEFLGQSVALLRCWGFEWFDLNLGCSVPKVTRAGAGAALARDIDKTLAAARLMIREAGELDPGTLGSVPTAQSGAAPVRGRVGFKIRLGWSASEENYLELARGLEQCGAAWLTLHPRYARQGFTGSADWAALGKLRRAVSIPVMASGDLFDGASGVRCLNETGVDGVMFARGALHNPAVFADYLAGLAAARSGGAALRSGAAEAGGQGADQSFGPSGGTGKAVYLENLGAADARNTPGPAGEVDASSAPGGELTLRRADFLRQVILRHAELARALPAPDWQQRGDRRRERDGRPEAALLKMRGSIPRYVKELPGSRAFRVDMSRCSSWDEFYELVEKFFAGVRQAEDF